MNYDKNYVEKNLIAYIGNKRRLLPLITDALGKIDVTSKNTKTKFLDLFAGTGVVSRLAKSLGYEVHTNDWEYYSYIMNKAFIGLDSGVVSNGFKSLGGINQVLSHLNSIRDAAVNDRYISEFYCPRNDDTADADRERLYYTRYNGLKIDGIRAQIDRWFRDEVINENEMTLLLALLLYEASTRSNTSGVFKAFHHGFGGTNGDALNRIMKEITLEKPVLCDGNGFVYNEDALLLSQKLSETKFDIVYLDPPYNQHQYGSNYHLLNTIAKNDKPEVKREFIIQGKKIDKSAIRKDWIKTRSNFCYKESAEKDFHKLISNLNADTIMISYSTDGIIPFDTFLDIASEKGKLSIVTSEYEKYRGGKQALTSELKNIEFVTMINTQVKRSHYDMTLVKKELVLNKISVAMKKTVSEAKLEESGYYIQQADTAVMNAVKYYHDHKVVFTLWQGDFIAAADNINAIMDMKYDVLETILADLEKATSLTREDEVYYTTDMIKRLLTSSMSDDVLELFGKLPYYMSKFNNKKAYKPSLYAFKNIFDMISETAVYWAQINVFKNKHFNRLETILLSKLNASGGDAETEELKKQIGKMYDELYVRLGNSSADSTHIQGYTEARVYAL